MTVIAHASCDEADLLRGRDEGLGCQEGKKVKAVHLAHPISDFSKSNGNIITLQLLTGTWCQCDLGSAWALAAKKEQESCGALVLLLDAAVAPRRSSLEFFSYTTNLKHENLSIFFIK